MAGMKAEIVIPLLVAAIASVFFYTAVGQDFAQDPGVRGAAPSASTSSP
jgi:hypothetical protein